MLKFVFITVLSLITSVSMSEVLMWQLNDTATVDGSSIYTFISAVGEDDDNWPAARVKVSGGQLVEPIYLDIWGENEFTGQPELWEGSGENGVWIGDVGGGYWGTGLNQSTLDAGIAADCIFVMQIGKNTYDAMTDTINWITLAESNPEYKSLLENHIYEEFSLAPLSETAWTPTEFHTVVPEPSSPVLIMAGLSILMLIRPSFGKSSNYGN